jgi:hypothetical protein
VDRHRDVALATGLALVTVRLVLELLIRSLPPLAGREPAPQRQPRSAWQSLHAFVMLEPLVAREWLKVFWWLFLISIVQVVTVNITFGVNRLSSVLGAVVYIAGVRFLIEVAMRLLPAGDGTAAVDSGPRPPQNFAGFFALRPFFTLQTLRLFWWLYIVAELLRLVLHLATYAVAGSFPPSPYRYMWHNVVAAPLMTLVVIATVRLLLEVLIDLTPALAQSEPATAGARSLLDDLMAFLELRPFFTPWWLQVFWWLFLLTVLADVYGYVSLVPGNNPFCIGRRIWPISSGRFTTSAACAC